MSVAEINVSLPAWISVVLGVLRMSVRFMCYSGGLWLMAVLFEAGSDSRSGSAGSAGSGIGRRLQA